LVQLSERSSTVVDTFARTAHAHVDDAYKKKYATPAQLQPARNLCFWLERSSAHDPVSQKQRSATVVE
jgi:hypothetical protein